MATDTPRNKMDGFLMNGHGVCSASDHGHEPDDESVKKILRAERLGVGPSDGAVMEYCVCKHCRSLYKPSPEEPCEACAKRIAAGPPLLYVDEDGRCTKCGRKVTGRNPGA